MKIVTFEPWHIDELLPRMREADNSSLEYHGAEGIKAMVLEASKFCMANSFITDSGEVAAVWICPEKWAGVFEVHAFTTDAVDNNVRAFYLACQRGLDMMHSELGCHRVEAAVHCDYAKSIAWLCKLGFRIEGRMVQYGFDKSDYYKMARVW